MVDRECLICAGGVALLLFVSGCIGPADNAPDGNSLRTCPASDARIGQTATLSTLAHGVSGVARIVDDCTIAIENFTYDGGGPEVVVYGDSDRTFSSPLILSANINGTVYSGHTLTVQIPEGATLDEVRAIAIWCVDFDINFGDAEFP